MIPIRNTQIQTALRVFLLSCCLAVNALGQGGSSQYIISHQLLGIEDGFAAREAFCGLQDQQGFIWFGTRNGLTRYDGRKCKVFSKRDYPMQGDNIIKLASDKQQQLFILYGHASYSGYLRLPVGKVDVLDQQTGQVRPLTQAFNKLPFREDHVFWIANDGTDRINIMTFMPYQLWQYTVKEGFSLRFEMKEWDTARYGGSVPTGPNQYFYHDYACLGLSSHEKQYLLNKNKAVSFTVSLPERYTAVNFRQGELLLQHTDYNSNRAGYSSVDISGKVNNVVNPKDLHLDGLLQQEGVLTIPIANDTACLFSIRDKGLYLYNNNALLPLFAAADTKNFPNLFFHESFADRLGNIWICSSGGVFRASIRRNRFTHYFTKKQQRVENNNQARGIWADSQGNVYANIWNRIFYQQSNGKQVNAFCNGINYALFKHAEKLYLTNLLLQEYRPATNSLTSMDGVVADREIFSALSLNDSMVLLGKMEHIYTFNTKTHTIKQVDPPNWYSITYRFLPRKDGTVWAVRENQLLLLSKEATIIDSISATTPQPLPASNLTDVFEDSKGNLWLTTLGNGLYCWNRHQNIVRRFGIEDGLPSSILYRIEEDAQQHLWISTENGLVLLDTQSGSIHSFFVKDGISDNEFNRLSSFRAADGRLFFGGIDGVTAFYPQEVINDTAVADIPLQVIGYQQFLAKDNKLVDLSNQFMQQPRIVLEPGDKLFNLEFRLLDYNNRIVHYAYKIEGQDHEWNHTTESNIRISGLPYGHYTLLVKAQTITGQWSSSQLSIPIDVLTPFYRKGWVQVVFWLLVATSVGLVVWLRTRKLERDKQQLESTVATRTVELQKSLGERELLLKEIHHRVKNNLQIISGLLDLQKEEIAEEESKAAFNEGQSRVKSIALIHQNLYQNDNLANIKFGSFVKEMAVQVGEVFEQLDTQLQVDIDMPDLLLDIDTAVPLGLIINELLTNAFKYATSKERQGTVHIRMEEQGNGHYTLVFADDGPGIQQAVDFNTAPTLGLRLIRGLAAQLYGEASYHYDRGSVFTITFKDAATRKQEG